MANGKEKLEKIADTVKISKERICFILHENVFMRNLLLKMQQSSGKVIASVFCNEHGIGTFFIEYLEKAQKMNSDSFVVQLVC